MASDTLEGFRLSPQQKRLWRLQQTDSALPYHARCVVAIRGPLDPQTLEQAIRTVVARHEILRTSFRLLPGISVPVQVISEVSAFVLVRDDLTSLGDEDQRARVESLRLMEAARQGGDFGQLPVVRAHLVKESPGEHRLLVTMPAFCADSSSLDRLIGQVAAAYGALAAGGETLSIEPMQYADFAEWANQLLEDPAGSAARDHWKQFALAGLDAYKLPGETSDPLARGFRPSSVPLGISADTVARIAVLAADLDLPLSSFLLACGQTLIWRLTGRSDVIVGTAFDGRKFAELQSTIGLLSTYLPIASDIVGDRAFTAMWSEVAGRVRDAHRRQEYFAWDTDGFFPYCFEFRTRAEPRSAAGVSFAIEMQDACIDRFTVKFVCEEDAGRVGADLQFDSSILSNEDALILAEQMTTLVEDASIRPGASLSELEIVGRGERRRLLVAFNETSTPHATGRCTHELFADQAARTPDAAAVVYEADRLTYRELNARANQLAHHLIQCGAGPDVPVGLCVERSIALIVGLFGILKAGAAYVPLDPSLPKSRLAMILDDAQVNLLVTTGKIGDGFGDGLRHIVRLDTDADLLRAKTAVEPRRRATDGNLVYVIFTSGSTGRPKGVAVEHRQLVNYVNAISDQLGVPAPSFAMISTIGADLGNTALFPALLTGGTLHLISDARASDPDLLGAYFDEHRIDCLKIVPSHLTALLSGSKPASVLPRNRLVLGGDVCPWSLVQRIKSLAPGTAIVNHYGPTETTVGALTYDVGSTAPDNTSGAVTLGRPLGNIRAYILDALLRPVPAGVAGDLHISGRGVARGYIGRPDATADKFIPDPFCETPGERMYKTGDRARYLRDGRIEFLGRTDDQVKVHGYRVEPGEIDVALRAHPAIASCVVLPRQDSSGETKLVAYLVAVDRQAPPAAELRLFLKDRVPEYMAPSAFVFLDRLPLTPNGKVDRHALPADYPRHSNERQCVAPRNAAEETLTAIWSGLLGLDPIGIHDNFFELGGDSILSIQIVARASQAGLRLSPRQVFQLQTIAELAAVAGTSAVAAAAQDVVTGDVPLTPVQARFFELEPPEPHHYNQAVMLELQGSTAPAVIEQALHHLLRHHDVLRLRAVRTNGVWRQHIALPDAATPFELVDLSTLSEAAQAEALGRHAARLHASLNVETGPIVRMALFNRGAGLNDYLLIVIHHLSVDVVSWGILLDDLAALLGQLRSGGAPLLPPKTTSFRTWAKKITEHARSEVRFGELPQWLSTPKRAPGLPVEAAGDNTAASARTISVALSADETGALLRDVPVAYRTQINEVLLTALVRTFAAWTGSSSLLLDLEGHGREEFDGVDLSRTVGWFTTIFPVWLDGGDATTPAETLRSVKERLRAIPDHGIGYGLLRYASGSQTVADKLRSLPQAQVRFNYLGRTDASSSTASLFRAAPASSGPSQSSGFPRTYLLNVIGMVSNGALRFDWIYSAGVHTHETVERLAQNYLDQLRLLIDDRHSAAAVSLIPSDFPGARALSRKDLDKVLSRLKEPHTGR